MDFDFAVPQVPFENSNGKFQRFSSILVANLVDLVKNKEKLVHVGSDILKKPVFTVRERQFGGNDEDSGIHMRQIAVGDIGIMPVDGADTGSVNDADSSF